MALRNISPQDRSSTSRAASGRARALALVLVAASAGLAAGQPPPTDAESLRQQGQAARAAGRYDEAASAFRQAMPLAPDESARIAALFDLAVTLQMEGEKSGDARWLDEAAEHYRELLAVKPDSASSWFNLARIHQARGDTGAAREAYAKAAEAGGSRAGFYRLQQAGYLRAAGGCAAAVPIYLDLALGPAPSPDAHDGLIACFAQDALRGDGRLPAYLWRLLARGEVRSARGAALAALEAGWPPPTRRELLTLVAESLGRSVLDPGEFLASEEAGRIAGLNGSVDLGAAPRELLLALRIAQSGSPVSRPGSELFPSWRDGDGGEPPGEGTALSPRDAMTSLLLALGDWLRQHERSGVAESILRLAATLEPNRVEVRAIDRLADLYVAQDDVAKVDRLLAEYESSLFAGKGAAYLEGRPDKIYEFHRTLGELYGYLASTGQRAWGNPSDPHSATFQLQRAYESWQAIPEASKADLDPGVVELLARCYQAGGEPARAAQLRVDAAQELDTRGDARGRDVLIQSVDETSLPPTGQQKLQVLRTRPQTLSTGARVGSTAVSAGETGKSNLVRGKAAVTREPQPDLRRTIAGSATTLTLRLSEVEAAVPAGSAEELATTLAAWLEPRKTKKYFAMHAGAQPELVRSWDGARGVAVLAIDGKEVAIPFTVAHE